MTIGHESLGRVIDGPANGEFALGDLVVGIIRSPCPDLCDGCRLGRLDLCKSRPLVERGIYGRDGYGSDHWVATAESLVSVPKELSDLAILTEPLSSLIKGARRIETAQQSIPTSRRETLLIAGAGPMGLLAAWALKQEFEHVFIIDPSAGRMAQDAVDTLTNTMMMTSWEDAPTGVDVFVDCSGTVDGIRCGLERMVHAGIVLLVGICGALSDSLPSQVLGRLVLDDITLIGTVNASREDYKYGAQTLANAPSSFLRSLITAEITPEEWPSWIGRNHRGEIKTVVRFRS